MKVSGEKKLFKWAVNRKLKNWICTSWISCICSMITVRVRVGFGEYLWSPCRLKGIFFLYVHHKCSDAVLEIISKHTRREEKREALSSRTIIWSH